MGINSDDLAVAGYTVVVRSVVARGVGDGSSSQCTTRPLARLHGDRALRARGETGAQTHLWG